MHHFKAFGFLITPEKYEHLVSIPQEKLFSWLEAGINIFPNLIVAILTLLLFYPFAKIAKFLSGKIFRRNLHNVALHGLFVNCVFLTVFMVGLFSALEILNLEKTVTSLLAGAGVIGLALGFAFQEIASNFVSGVLIASRKPFRLGDVIEVQGRRGSVQSMDLRTTTIITADGKEVILPNKQLITEALTNFTSTPELKVEVLGGVSYQDDLEKVELVVQEAVANLPQLHKGKKTEFNFIRFGQSSIDFKLEFWIVYPGDSNHSRSIHQAIVNIKKAFDKNGITIPYPIQTVDMRMANLQEETKSQARRR